MGCFTFYIFNRKGRCQYYHEWQRLKPVRQGAGSQVRPAALAMLCRSGTLSSCCCPASACKAGLPAGMGMLVAPSSSSECCWSFMGRA